MTLNLTGRYFRPIPLDAAGYETEVLALEARKTALVAMHCWNIGCEDGPLIDKNFFVGMGSLESFREAERIMRECIRPAMDAARQAGALVCHVECELIARRHPEALEDSDPSDRSDGSDEGPPVVSGWRKKMENRFHGEDYPTRSPLARMDRARIVFPLPGEPFVHQTAQLDRTLRRRGIENLVYAGFATDMCVLRAPGGIEPMAGKEYRLFLMRDATIGVECPDTFGERIATRWAIRYFETHFGHTVSCEDFIAACRGRQGKA
jgi:nicotinamidase-related amidase